MGYCNDAHFGLPSLTAAVVATLLLLACQVSMAQQEYKAGGSVPEETLLRSRLKEFWRAVGTHDIMKRYEMTTPTVRQLVSAEQFKKTWDWEEDSSVPKQEIKADLSRVCGCVRLRFLRCTLELALNIEQPGKPSSHKRTLQAWEFADGQWYEAYSGAPYSSRCPDHR